MAMSHKNRGACFEIEHPCYRKTKNCSVPVIFECYCRGARELIRRPTWASVPGIVSKKPEGMFWNWAPIFRKGSQFILSRSNCQTLFALSHDPDMKAAEDRIRFWYGEIALFFAPQIRYRSFFLFLPPYSENILLHSNDTNVICVLKRSISWSLLKLWIAW